ncbi:MAG: hypothetical protein ACOYMF_01675 [Bacteroidales bacterium]
MRKLTGLLLVIIVIASGCAKKDDSTKDEFSNSLKLGTGMNASNFTLTGEGTVFQQQSTIYFRLESKDDMAGSPVRITVKNLATSLSENYEYPSLQSYGHIYMSAISAPLPGSYTATGILTTGNKTIAYINFTVQ